MGLSHRGVSINLSGSDRGGDPLSVQDYVNAYHFHVSQKSRTQVPIGQIASFPLKVIVRTITQVASVLSVHLATRSHMHLGVDCVRNAVFE